MPDKPAKKYPFYFYLIALIIPVVFFLVLEGLLRVTGYGEEIPQWIDPSEKASGYQMLNPEIARRYFHTLKKLPTPHFDAFRTQKLENTYRVFVIGGSTAAGFPYPMNGAFSRFIKRYLEIQYPSYDIEVVNLAISAINSYTLRDFMPGVVAQKPDLILIYAGHNEYYGALGAGSSQFWGSSRVLVNLMLDAADIRILQLLRNVIITVRGWFAADPVSSDVSTLMEGMVGEQLIPLYSRVYENGIRQFEGNMNDLVLMAKTAGIPLIISTMTANLRDQTPFESAQVDSLPPADQVYREAKKYDRQGSFPKAVALYHRAKELDMLRFRAPEGINRVIRNISRRHQIPLIEMDSVFANHASDGMVGNDLMTDHVHPKIFGIELMGRAFASVMEAHNLVPKANEKRLEIAEAQYLAAQTHTMTRLDSAYGDLRLRYLKGGWPFRKSAGPNPTLRTFRPADRIEQLSLDVFTEKIHWGEAHIRAGFWYKDRSDLAHFERELLAVIEVLPSNESTYKILIDGLIEHNRLDRAFNHLQRMEHNIPGAYSAKWLGIYYLVNQNYQQAGGYLEQSLKRNSRDPQAFYNLAGVYIHEGNYTKALELINSCLELDPDFEGAARTKADLERALGTAGSRQFFREKGKR